MGKPSLIPFQFPLGGLNRRYSYQQQPPYTTPDCQNVRPNSVYEGRARGGSRPGLGKVYQGTQLGVAGHYEIQMLSSVQRILDNGYREWADYFDRDGYLGTSDSWTIASWIPTATSTNSTLYPQIMPDDETTADLVKTAGAVLDSMNIGVGTVAEPLPYTVEIFIVPYSGKHGGKYQLFACMTTLSPRVVTEGLKAEIIFDSDTDSISGSLTVYKNLVAVTTTAFTIDAAVFPGTGVPQEGWFSMVVTGKEIECYWRGSSLCDVTHTQTLDGKRVGFGMDCTEPGEYCTVDIFRLKYTDSAVIQDRDINVLVASAGGKLYRETHDGLLQIMKDVGGACNISTNHITDAVEMNQKLYIADYDQVKLSGTGAKITSATSGLLTDASYPNFAATTPAPDPDNDVLIIDTASPDSLCGTYRFTFSGIVGDIFPLEFAGALALTPNPGVGSGIAYRVLRAPKVYDPALNTHSILTATTTKGQVPNGCPLIARYRNRIVLAGAAEAANNWYMSRLNDPLDWYYFDDGDDAARAVAGTNSEAGELGEPIRALIAHGDDYLIFGCLNSIWVLRGDPAYGGQIDNISREIGIISQRSWCKTPEGHIVFLGLNGIYILAAGFAQEPTSFSEEIVPKELKAVNPDLIDISMAYDACDIGIHLFLTDKKVKKRTHWWIDWKTKTFWPVVLQTDHDPFSVCRYDDLSAGDSRIVLGCRDGYIRGFSNKNHTDDGTEIESWIKYGPINLGGSDYYEGRLEEFDGVLGMMSGPVNWYVYIAGSEEASVKKRSDGYVASGTWTAGINAKIRPGVSGTSLTLKLENGATGKDRGTWIVEKIMALVRRTGERK